MTNFQSDFWEHSYTFSKSHLLKKLNLKIYFKMCESLLARYLSVQLVGTGRGERKELWRVMSRKGIQYVWGVGGGGNDIITHNVFWEQPCLEMKSQSISVMRNNVYIKRKMSTYNPNDAKDAGMVDWHAQVREGLCYMPTNPRGGSKELWMWYKNTPGSTFHIEIRGIIFKLYCP